MIIRTMNDKDKPELMLLLQDTPEFTPAEVELADEVVSDYLADPAGSGYFALVAEENNHIIGFVCYGPTPITEGTWDMYWLAVDHNQQGKGIGRQLMAAAEDKIKAAGGRLIVLETSSKPGYEKTNRFYLYIGYKEAARIKDYYMIGDDLVIYEKRFSR